MDIELHLLAKVIAAQIQVGKPLEGHDSRTELGSGVVVEAIQR